jgi:hypothetical protein
MTDPLAEDNDKRIIENNQVSSISIFSMDMLEGHQQQL